MRTCFPCVCCCYLHIAIAKFYVLNSALHGNCRVSAKEWRKTEVLKCKIQTQTVQYNEIENTTAFTSDFGPQDLKRIDAASLKTPYF